MAKEKGKQKKFFLIKKNFQIQSIYILLITILEGTFIHYNQFLMEFCVVIIQVWGCCGNRLVNKIIEIR